MAEMSADKETKPGANPVKPAAEDIHSAADKANRAEEELRQLKLALAYLIDIYRMEARTEVSRGHLVETRWLLNDSQILEGVIGEVARSEPGASNDKLFSLVHSIRYYVMTQER